MPTPWRPEACMRLFHPHRHAGAWILPTELHGPAGYVAAWIAMASKLARRNGQESIRALAAHVPQLTPRRNTRCRLAARAQPGHMLDPQAVTDAHLQRLEARVEAAMDIDDRARAFLADGRVAPEGKAVLAALQDQGYAAATAQTR